MQGPAVGEDLLQLRPGHARPGAHIAGIHMDEGAAGGGVEADAADLVLHRGFAELGQVHPGNEHIHRLAAHVLRIVGDA